jgi:hypothetical protein
MVKQYTNLIDKIPHTIRLVFKKYVKILYWSGDVTKMVMT